jgi:hypothetical protein
VAHASACSGELQFAVLLPQAEACSGQKEFLSRSFVMFQMKLLLDLVRPMFQSPKSGCHEYDRKAPSIGKPIAWIYIASTFFTAMSLCGATENQAVLTPLQKIFDGIAEKNSNLIREQLLPGGTATLIRNGQVLQLHFDAFVATLSEIISRSPERWEERIYDPLVRVDDDIAIIWAPYTAFRGGKIDHCGTNIVNLIHRDGRWLISGLADNSRTSCPAR